MREVTSVAILTSSSKGGVRCILDVVGAGRRGLKQNKITGESRSEWRSLCYLSSVIVATDIAVGAFVADAEWRIDRSVI